MPEKHVICQALKLEPEMDEDDPHDLDACHVPSFARINRFAHQLAPTHLSFTHPCFKNDVWRTLGPVGPTPIRIDVSGFDAPLSQLSDCRNLLAKRQRVADGAKILLDIAKESSDWFPPLKSALGGISALINHYEVLVRSEAVAHS